MFGRKTNLVPAVKAAGPARWAWSNNRCQANRGGWLTPVVLSNEELRPLYEAARQQGIFVVPSRYCGSS